MEMLEIEVDRIRTWAHAYVVPDVPYRLFLGRPWQHLIHLLKDEDTNGIYISLRDPTNPANTRWVSTTPRLSPHHSLALTAAVLSTTPPPHSPLSNLSAMYTSSPHLPVTSPTDIYHAIKSFGDVIAGFPTQHA
jgi:hypothetical protein